MASAGCKAVWTSGRRWMPLPPGTPRSRTPTTALGPESCSETHGNLSPAYLSPCYHCSSLVALLSLQLSCRPAIIAALLSPCYHCSSLLCSSRNKPDGPQITDGDRVLCSTYYKSEILNAWELNLSDKCRDVKPDREHYRKKGLINIYLTQVYRIWESDPTPALYETHYHGPI